MPKYANKYKLGENFTQLYYFIDDVNNKRVGCLGRHIDKCLL